MACHALVVLHVGHAEGARKRTDARLVFQPVSDPIQDRLQLGEVRLVELAAAAA